MELEDLFLSLSLQILLLLQENLHMCLRFYRRMQVRRAELLYQVIRPRRSRIRATGRAASKARRTLLAGTSRRSSERATRAWFALACTPNPPRYWVYPRSCDWWESCVMALWGDEQWLADFRMTRQTFMELVEALRGRLQRESTTMRQAIPVEKRVGVALWYLANANTYREVREQFGVGLSTVAEIVVEVCLAIEAELFSKIICLGPDVPEVMAGFTKLGFPQCVGVLGGLHLPIRHPGGRAGDNANRKHLSSVLLLATVDHSGRFIDAEIGHSGKNDDAFVFINSKMCKAMDKGVYVPGNPTLTLEGVAVPPVILADGDFPMRRWLMKPYAPPCDAQEKHFNYQLSQARKAVDCAFGRLKARWRCLTAKLTVFPHNVTSLVAACVVLHNLCEVKGHEVPQTAMESTHPDATIVRTASPERYDLCDDMSLREGQAVRDVLAGFIARRNAR